MSTNSLSQSSGVHEMGKQPNLILSVMRARAGMLIKRLEETTQMKHAGTKGDLREAYLMDFLVPLFMGKCRVEHGFIVDTVGTEQSPQIDLIFFDDGFAPSVELARGIHIVPLESALLICEIKSRLDSNGFDQVNDQLSILNNMYLTSENDCTVRYAQRPSFAVPAAIFCFETDLSDEKIKQKLRDTKGLISICVGTKKVFFKGKDNEIECKMEEGLSEAKPLFVFCAILSRLTSMMRAARQAETDGSNGFHLYLQADEFGTPGNAVAK